MVDALIVSLAEIVHHIPTVLLASAYVRVDDWFDLASGGQVGLASGDAVGGAEVGGVVGAGEQLVDTAGAGEVVGAEVVIGGSVRPIFLARAW